jgi:hypothetical protein
MFEAIIKTGNTMLDRKIDEAIRVAREMYESQDSPRKKLLIKGLLRAAIGFRVAEYLKLDGQKSRYAEKADKFYRYLDRVGVEERTAVDMVKRITKIIV